jgi:hypothetical protein
MLVRSPPLPLIVDYTYGYHDITTEDKEATILALKLRDRVRRIHLYMPVLSLQVLIVHG